MATSAALPGIRYKRISWINIWVMNHSGPTPPGAGCHCPPTFLQRNFIFNFPWLIFEFCHISGSNQSKMFLSKFECRNWKIFPSPPYSLYIWPPCFRKQGLGPVYLYILAWFSCFSIWKWHYLAFFSAFFGIFSCMFFLKCQWDLWKQLWVGVFIIR